MLTLNFACYIACWTVWETAFRQVCLFHSFLHSRLFKWCKTISCRHVLHSQTRAIPPPSYALSKDLHVFTVQTLSCAQISSRDFRLRSARLCSGVIQFFSFNLCKYTKTVSDIFWRKIEVPNCRTCCWHVELYLVYIMPLIYLYSLVEWRSWWKLVLPKEWEGSPMHGWGLLESFSSELAYQSRTEISWSM